MAGHPKGVFEIYRSDNKEWYWRLKAANNRVIAVGGEGFKTKQGAVHGIYAVADYVTKQVMGGRGMHCDICEIDKDNHEIDYPRPRREYEMVIANEDKPGAVVIHDPSAKLAMEKSIAELSKDAVSEESNVPPSTQPSKVTKKVAKKRVAKKKATKEVESVVQAIKDGGFLENLSDPRPPDPITGGILDSPAEIDDTIIGDPAKLSADDFAKWRAGKTE